MTPPYASRTRRLSGTAWEGILTIQGVPLCRTIAIRIQGASLAWRVVADGVCGREVLANGSIGASPTGPTRVTGLPETIGAARLVVEVQGSVGHQVAVEASWVPTVVGPQNEVLLMGPDYQVEGSV